MNRFHPSDRVEVRQPDPERMDSRIGSSGAGVISGPPERVATSDVGSRVTIFGREFLADVAQTYWPVELDTGDHIVAAEYLLRHETEAA